MVANYATDVLEDIVAHGVLRGREEVRAFFSELVAAVPDLHVTLTRLVTAGGREVVAEWRMGGTFSGAAFDGIDATGKHVEVRGLDLFEVEDGQVVANTAYYDGLEFARQVGMMPARASGAERAMKSAFNGTTKLRRMIDERIGL
jgi:steroid delta-isomerase-like uncharacterized protein